MKQTLISLGWEMYYECLNKCGGKQYFTNELWPKYEVRTRVKSNTFSILLENKVIAGPFMGYVLKEKINEHFPKAKQTTA